MKVILKFFALFCLASAAVGIAACSGNTDETMDDQYRPVLNADKSSIAADGADAVAFTVTYDGKDVTSSSTIRCTSHTGISVSGARFSTTAAGNYVFEAVYDNKTSAACKVSAVQSGTQAASRFVRKVCVMEFTGQWCAMCPTGYNYLWYVVSRNYAETAHIIALHDNSQGIDEMAIPVQRELFSAFKLVGYPSAVIDLRDTSPLTDDNAGALKKGIETSLYDYPAHCGVAVASNYDEESGKASVTARLFPEVDGEYRIALWVVEDNIVSKQNQGGRYEDNYTHNHVARRLASESWKGDNLGNIAAGKEVTKNYEINVDGNWNIDNTSVFALAVDASGHVNNMAACPLKDGKADYEYVSR